MIDQFASIAQTVLSTFSGKLSSTSTDRATCTNYSIDISVHFQFKFFFKKCMNIFIEQIEYKRRLSNYLSLNYFKSSGINENTA